MHFQGKLIEHGMIHDVSGEYVEAVPAGVTPHITGQINLPSGLVVRVGTSAQLLLDDGREIEIVVTKLRLFNGLIEFEQAA